MKPRKIIFECHVGSKLYGTDRPDSDDDFMGVFLPSTEDLFSMQNGPSEWSCDEKVSNGARNSKGDIDRKYYSLQKFLNLTAQGQPKQIEMLFAPHDKIIIATPEWDKIINNKQMFLSKNSVLPFIGFAKAQAYKATLKGDNLNKIRNISSSILPNADILVGNCVYGEIGNYKLCGESVEIEEIEYRPGIKMKCVIIAGRKFEYTQSLKRVRAKLLELEAKYGTRSEAAAEAGYDYKSLMHTYRLLSEAEQLLRTGKLEFPLSRDVCGALRTIRGGQYVADFFNEINDKLISISSITSPLPESVNREEINKLCIEMQMEYHFGKTE